MKDGVIIDEGAPQRVLTTVASEEVRDAEHAPA
jgi:hypothetical protein